MTRACLFALACLLTPTLLSADYQAGLDAYLEGDYDIAVVEWQDVVEGPPGAVPLVVRVDAVVPRGSRKRGPGVDRDRGAIRGKPVGRAGD